MEVNAGSNNPTEADRKELELLVDQLIRDEEICGVNTYEWVVEALLESGAIKIDRERKLGIIIPLQEV